MDISIRFTLFIGLILGGSFSAGQELRITPDYKLASEDSATLFKCEAFQNQQQDADLKWFHIRRDGSEVQITDINGRVYIQVEDEYTLKLYITSVVKDDAGTYKCTGIVGGTEEEVTVRLDLYKDITFDNAPTHQTPTEFTDATIACQVSGNPNPEVSWRYKGATLHTGGRYTVDTRYGLIIDNITEEDNGQYKCQGEVTSRGSVKFVLINVEVYKKPTITQELGTTIVVENHEGALKCQASGHPFPEYTFKRVEEDGTETLVSDTDTRHVDTLGGELSFRPVTIGDQSTYKCVATNAAGEAESEGYLDVQVIPEIYNYINVSEEEGNSVTLRCLSKGEPQPDMSFRKVHNSYDYTLGPNDNGRIEVANPNSGELLLTVTNLTPDDTANYTCKSKNEAGFGEKNGTITVLYSPRFVEGQKTHYYSWAGKVRNMTCMTKAEPAPTFEWWHGGKRLVANETYRIFELIKNSVLQVTVRDSDAMWTYGQFQCLARNDYGENTLEMTLERAMEPDAPKEVIVLESTATKVTFRVIPPDQKEDLPLLGVRVSFENVQTDFNLGEEILIDGLHASTTYVFTFRARNEVGVGMPLTYTHQTESITRPYPVTITSDTIGQDPYDYKLYWEKPRTGGIPIREYRFRYRRVRVEDGTTNVKEPAEKWQTELQEDDSNAPITAFILRGLKPESYYQVEVKARNDIDWSLANSEFVFKTSPDPEIGENSDNDKDVKALQTKSGMNTATVIGIVIAVFFIFLIIVDISCYFLNNCGITKCICVNVCGDSEEGRSNKEKLVNEAEKGEGSDNRASPVDAKVNFEDEKKAEPIAEEQEAEQPEEALPEDEKKPLDEQGGEVVSADSPHHDTQPLQPPSTEQDPLPPDVATMPEATEDMDEEEVNESTPLKSPDEPRC